MDEQLEQELRALFPVVLADEERIRRKVLVERLINVVGACMKGFQRLPKDGGNDG